MHVTQKPFFKDIWHLICVATIRIISELVTIFPLLQLLENMWWLWLEIFSHCIIHHLLSVLVRTHPMTWNIVQVVLNYEWLTWSSYETVFMESESLWSGVAWCYEDHVKVTVSVLDVCAPSQWCSLSDVTSFMGGANYWNSYLGNVERGMNEY